MWARLSVDLWYATLIWTNDVHVQLAGLLNEQLQYHGKHRPFSVYQFGDLEQAGRARASGMEGGVQPQLRANQSADDLPPSPPGSGEAVRILELSFKRGPALRFNPIFLFFPCATLPWT